MGTSIETMLENWASSRIDWKYLLGLSLSDPGFDASVPCEFHSRLVKEKAEALL